ncbi:hypothetical protein AQUCO_02300137v1 [Aquilegia coerulea]|uniref:WAT1-related protein n=1 Tax=Aquilegia coerulea TaxID=218851 RepID=A0A2G5DD35_AQUCA|nr:hypothetical protein AQUCO_02300137v1 [Aquilegia coerulea]
MEVETQKPYLAMILTQFIYAGMALFSKIALDVGMSPYVFLVYRQAFASLALAPFTFLLERKKAPPMTYSILFKIFLASLFGMTLSMNLYYVALSYTSATFAAASTNAIPALTFIIAAILRMESISMKRLYGVAKVLGSIICVSGALLVALNIGPPIEFMNWYSPTHKEVSSPEPSPVESNSKLDWVKGALIMLSANTTWSLWLIMQGIVVTGITYWLQVWCIEKKGPVFTSMFTPLALLITAIISAFLWKETMHWGSVCGALLLVGGLFGVLWGKKKEECHEKETKTRSQVDNVDVVLECITHHI